MKTFDQLREELESINELSTSLLKRYAKKADGKIDAHLAKKKPTSSDQDKYHKRVSGKFRAQDKIDGYANVPANSGASAADHKKAKAVAHNIAKAHKDLKVSSHGDNHFVHHKDDEDGHEHIRVRHDSPGKVTVSHEYGMAGSHHKEKTLSHAAAVKHGHSIVNS